MKILKSLIITFLSLGTLTSSAQKANLQTFTLDKPYTVE